MKKVSGSNVPTSSTTGASTLTATGGVAMRRTGSGGSGRELELKDEYYLVDTSQLPGRLLYHPGNRGIARVFVAEKPHRLVCKSRREDPFR
jgi:hypothetical protein